MPATYEPIATTTLGTASATITFSSIPATYTDLKVILVVNGSSANFTPQLRFNGSSGGTEYSELQMYVDGAGTIAGVTNTSSDSIGLTNGGGMTSANVHFFNIDIFSYAGSTFKTILYSYSSDRNGSGFTGRNVGIRRNTAAITSIAISSSSAATFSIGTTATLFGIKAA
jgi:hypothetical protein